MFFSFFVFMDGIDLFESCLSANQGERFDETKGNWENHIHALRIRTAHDIK